MGFSELGRTGSGGQGSGLRARPKREESFIFSEIIFQCKTNSGKPQKMFKGTKNTQKFQENS
jgi:hypothetical protein